jgi:hypothetical protein
MSTAWFKSTFSGSDKTCVEVAHPAHAVLIKDSKLGDQSPIISLSPSHWSAVLDLVIAAESGTVADELTVTLLDDGGASIRNSDDITLTYNVDEWDAFAKGVADGQFDRT